MYTVTITETKAIHSFDDRKEAKAFAKALRKRGVWCFLQFPK